MPNRRTHSPAPSRAVALAAIGALVFLAAARPSTAQQLPPVPVPPGNAITEAKRVLGKILFWDEQLSSDDTIACGTCHIPAAGGADPRVAVNPGPDGLSGTADDVLGSFGVMRRDFAGNPLADPVFGFGRQVTGRTAPSNFSNLHSPELFWDGRASSSFADPLDPGSILLASGGALESQAVGPILSSVEMARDGRTWSDVVDKLALVRPLRLADDIPADAAAAIAERPSYPELFAAAFGDAGITPARIAFAIATYERTLSPDQTPWDRFIAGNNAAMTAAQVQGWNVFRGPGSRCASCHTPPFFTNSDFLNIGVRPTSEDEGRFAVTGLAEDHGDMKVPGLRNVGLRTRLMHTGGIDDVADAIDFYLQARGHAFFTDNLDAIPPDATPLDQIRIRPEDRPALADFLANALTDPRAAAETFPFDRPTLASEATGTTVRCADAPLDGCLSSIEAGRSRVKISEGSRAAIQWKLSKGEAFSAGDVGDPTSGSGLVFCLYDGAVPSLLFEGRAGADADCTDGTCWRSIGSQSSPRGWRYKSGSNAPDGVRRIVVKAGEAGAAKVAVSLVGDEIASSPFGAPALPVELPLVVQLQSPSGQCWSLTHSSADENGQTDFASR